MFLCELIQTVHGGLLELHQVLTGTWIFYFNLPKTLRCRQKKVIKKYILAITFIIHLQFWDFEVKVNKSVKFQALYQLVYNLWWLSVVLYFNAVSWETAML